jgi:glycosyltransferase involved in cell wall biosynthesis
MQISVIIPSYNRADLLPFTLDSVLAQERPADEIVVVDDGSSDDTGEVVAGYQRAHPTVRYVRRENGGLAAARNTGYAEARGDALLFLDSDDLLLPAALRALEAALCARPDAPLAFCRAQIVDSAGAVIEPVWEVEDEPEDIWENLLGANKLRSPGAVLVRKAAIERVGTWDPELRGSEDWDMWLRLSEDGAPFARVPEALFQYRVHGTNMSGDRDLMRRIGLKVYEKHLERHRDDPARFALVWQRYQACLTPEEMQRAEKWARLVAAANPTGGQVPDRIEQALAQSRRHRMLRGLIEKSGVAVLYRKTPLSFRLKMRAVFGIDADAV